MKIAEVQVVEEELLDIEEIYDLLNQGDSSEKQKRNRINDVEQNIVFSESVHELHPNHLRVKSVSGFIENKSFVRIVLLEKYEID